jgi:hypothetical protein
MKQQNLIRKIFQYVIASCVTVSITSITFSRYLTHVPIHKLDEARIICWIDGKRVIARTLGTGGQEFALDIQNGQWLNPFGELSNESYPNPAPDGRWLLYQEFPRNVSVKDLSQSSSRFRLVPRGGGPGRFAPANGAYSLKRAWAWCWLPDSQGWIALRRGPDRRLEITRFDIDHPNSPHRLSPPSTFAGSLVPEWDFEHYAEAKITTSGDLVWADEQNLYFWPLSEREAVRKVTLHLPKGTIEMAADSLVDSPRRFALFPDGRSLLVCVAVVNQLHGSQTRWEFQRIPINGGKPKVLFSLNQKVALYYLSTDGKGVVYKLWRVNNASNNFKDRYLGSAFWSEIK